MAEMGSDFVSIAEAARLLKRSKKTVTAYLNSGALRRVRNGIRVVIPVADVEALSVDIGTNLPAMNKKTFYQLVARVQRLEMAVAVLRKATGIGASPLRPSKEESVGLYEAAIRALAAGKWEQAEIDVWADLYEKMDEVFFDILGSYVARTDAWRPFFELCIAQARQVSQHEDFPRSLGLQQRHDRLRLSIREMRNVILVWVETGGGVSMAAVMPVEDLAKRLSEKPPPSLG
jgi:hypothetical protein